MISGKYCKLCGKQLDNRPKYCSEECGKIGRRINRHKKIGNKNKVFKRIRTYIRKYGYTCYYSKIPLNLNDHTNPYYLTFDHLIPRLNSEIVLAAAVINDMKSDMSEQEFEKMINQLSLHFLKNKKVTPIKLKYWKRGNKIFREKTN
jgi:hypothetical protein